MRRSVIFNNKKCGEKNYKKRLVNLINDTQYLIIVMKITKINLENIH